MQARFHGGVYVGRRFETSEVLVSMSDGSIVKARDFREVPDASAWDAEALKAIAGTPWNAAGTVPLQHHDEDDEKLPCTQVTDI